MGAMNHMISRKHVSSLFFFLLLFICKTTTTIIDSGSPSHTVEVDDAKQTNGSINHDQEDKVGGFQVASGTREYRPLHLELEEGLGVRVIGHERRRELGPFQVCLVCRCCVMVSDPTTCFNMPCCFGIDCQLPNKPFGVCAFVPRTCNCTSCSSV